MSGGAGTVTAERKRVADEESVEASVQGLCDLLRRSYEEAKQRPFTFLLAGRTGVGKSSTINSLLGQPLARVGHYEPETADVVHYPLEIGGVHFEFVDTPGLCDDLEEEGNDARYLQLIRSKVSEVHAFWFMTSLADTRVSGEEKRAILLLTKAFGADLWTHAVIVFTFANHKADDFENAIQQRTRLIRQAIAQAIDRSGQPDRAGIAETVPSVAIDNKSELLPSGMPWKGELYVTTVKRIGKHHRLTFVFGTQERVGLAVAPEEAEGAEEDERATKQRKPKSKRKPAAKAAGKQAEAKQPRIELNPEQQEELEASIWDAVGAYATAGAKTLGKLGQAMFGRSGRTVGRAVGGVLGGIWGAIRYASGG